MCGHRCRYVRREIESARAARDNFAHSVVMHCDNGGNLITRVAGGQALRAWSEHWRQGMEALWSVL